MPVLRAPVRHRRAHVADAVGGRGDRAFPVNDGALCVKGWTRAAVARPPRAAARPRWCAIAPAGSCRRAGTLRPRSDRRRHPRHDPHARRRRGRRLRQRRADQREGLPARQVRPRRARHRQHRLQRPLLHVVGARRPRTGRSASTAGCPSRVADIAGRRRRPARRQQPAPRRCRRSCSGSRRSRAAAARSIVVDPRRTPTARWPTCTCSSRPAPTWRSPTACCTSLIEDGLIDAAYIARPHDRLRRGPRRRRRATGPSRVERVTGVAGDAARRRGAAGSATPARAMMLTGRGPEQQSQGRRQRPRRSSTSRSRCGRSAAAGSGFGCLTGQGNGQGGREHGQKADQLPGYRLDRGSDARRARRQRLGRRRRTRCPERASAPTSCSTRSAPTAASARSS